MTQAEKKTKKAATKATTKKTASKQKSNATKGGAKLNTDRLAGARRAVNVPLDAVRGAANRVGVLVSPVTDRVGGDQKVAAFRGQVEETLKNFGDRAEKIQTDLTKALEGQAGRAQELIGQARSQLSNLRP